MKTMTFQEMYDGAKRFGISESDMRRNCQAQLAQYERLTKAPNDKWSTAVQSCRDMLKWLDAK